MHSLCRYTQAVWCVTYFAGQYMAIFLASRSNIITGVIMIFMFIKFLFYLSNIYISTSRDDVIMEHFSAILALSAGNSRVTGEFPSQRPALMFSLICAWKKRLSKQTWGWWFEKPSCPLWRHCNVEEILTKIVITLSELFILWTHLQRGPKAWRLCILPYMCHTCSSDFLKASQSTAWLIFLLW